jgi:hypothetical protein
MIYKESLRYTVQAMALYAIFSFVTANSQALVGGVAGMDAAALHRLDLLCVVPVAHDFILNVRRCRAIPEAASG